MAATDDPADVGVCDYVLFCVKSYDTESAAARLAPLLGDGTAVLSLQNGVDNEEKLAAAVGTQHVVGGAAFIFAGIGEPGVVVHTGGPTSITFGELDGHSTERCAAPPRELPRRRLRRRAVVGHQDRPVGQAGVHLRTGRG